MAESTVRSRVLMSVFLDSIDLLERIMTSQYDYEVLHSKFEKTGILEIIAVQLHTMAAELQEIGLALQRGIPSGNSRDLDDLQRKTLETFIAVRKENINTKTIEDFIALRQIIYSLQDITERIKRLHLSTRYDKRISREYKNDAALEKFIPSGEIDLKLLLSNLTFTISSFRHAVRLTVALLAGYFISLFYPIGSQLLDIANHRCYYQAGIQHNAAAQLSAGFRHYGGGGRRFFSYLPGEGYDSLVCPYHYRHDSFL